MRTRPALCFTAILVLALVAVGQQVTAPVQRDPQAIFILMKAIAAAGGGAAIEAIQDFTATGNITYYWAEGPVQGAVAIKSLGLSDFQMDATLPGGVRSLVASSESGGTKDVDGSIRGFDPRFSSSLGAITFPLLRAQAAVDDLSTKITYLGEVTHDGQETYEIGIQSMSLNPPGLPNPFAAQTFFFNSATSQLIAVQSPTYRRDDFAVGPPHELRFSDFRNVNNIAVPYSIVDELNGTPGAVIQLSSMTFNSGLGDSDFQALRQGGN